MSHTNTVSHSSAVNFSIGILANKTQKPELKLSPVFQKHQLLFAEDLQELVNLKADAYIDLLFEADPERIKVLAGLLPSPIFINSVIHTLTGIHSAFIRINGWPGFLESPLLEASANEDSIEKAKRIFGEQMIFVKDVPGFVTPRIISMIINEAYYTFGAGTSSREEIDTAMKLGTGYPMGPFEWSEKIGLFRVGALLTALGKVDPLYVVAPNLVDGCRKKS
jgi:3-hydroxybutyryl-CoA dehydrogenase